MIKELLLRAINDFVLTDNYNSFDEAKRIMKRIDKGRKVCAIISKERFRPSQKCSPKNS